MPESIFYRTVRQYVVTAPTWATDLIRYETLPDERHDLTLISQRIYGNRYDFLAVQAAAGLDRVDDELTERVIYLPSAERLNAIKQATGYDPRPPSMRR